MDVQGAELDNARKEIEAICDKANSRSQLFLSGSHGHLNGIRHFYLSSSKDASFSVEPGSANDLAEIMKVIKKYTTVKFAIKGGGHTSNPDFSSTRGIQISLLRFNKISFNKDKAELTVGTGCAFDEIYKFIRPYNSNIVGGGGSVGIGGWMMGGGYSIKTNWWGLGIDNLIQATVVLPDGSQVVTARKEEDESSYASKLFWAIRGGGNNFGIATEFILKTHPQGTNENGYVYGGILTFDEGSVKRVKEAIIKFTEKRTPKAAIEAIFRCYRNSGDQEFMFTVFAFYDDKKPEGPNPFSDFLAIDHKGELKNSKYERLDAAQTLLYSYIPADDAIGALSAFDDDDSSYSFPSEIVGMGILNVRARWGSVMVSGYKSDLIDAVEKEVQSAKGLMERYKGRMVMADIWPFLSTMFAKSTDSAWPHRSGEPNGPLIVYFMWEGKENDDIWIDRMVAALKVIQEAANKAGCAKGNEPVYCNTTLVEATTHEQIYRGNIRELSRLRATYDPHNVMERTGGFRIPLGSSTTVDED